MKKVNSYYFIAAITFTALLPQYLIRCNLSVAWYFYEHFSTYYGDLWYCWYNYLSKGFSFPIEYPAGIQIIFKLLFHVPNVTQNYVFYMALISCFLTLLAIISSLFLYRLSTDIRRICLLWCFAPSFLFYGLLNVDFIPIATIVISYYYFNERRYGFCASWLALGTAIKVFPIFLFPIYFFSCPKTERKQFLIYFIEIWIAFNFPFMVSDWHSWIFPYLWQIQNNYAISAHDGSWTWLVYTLFNHYGFGSWSGKISLLIFASGYFLIIRKHWNLPLARKLMIVIILFLLTDRIYSPQYNLYLLPFLVLVDYKISLKWFYLLEIPSFIQGFFLFAVKNNPFYLQSLIGLKYIALILLLRECIVTERKV